MKRAQQMRLLASIVMTMLDWGRSPVSDPWITTPKPAPVVVLCRSTSNRESAFQWSLRRASSCGRPSWFLQSLESMQLHSQQFLTVERRTGTLPNSEWQQEGNTAARRLSWCFFLLQINEAISMDRDVHCWDLMRTHIKQLLEKKPLNNLHFAWPSTIDTTDKMQSKNDGFLREIMTNKRLISIIIQFRKTRLRN